MIAQSIKLDKLATEKASVNGFKSEGNKEHTSSKDVKTNDKLDIQKSNKNAWPKALGLAGASLLGLMYLKVVINSKEKWFHFLLMAVLTFGAIQIWQFY